MTEGPLAAYRARLGGGALAPDPAQALAAEKLQSLWHALKDYRPASGSSGWRERFGLAKRGVSETPPQGLYIYGPVGRGKSMLMDLFFASAPLANRRRVHFHEFMQEIHRELHRWRQVADRKEADPIPKLARQIAQNAWLLCLDELQVTDIADAMILGRLFEHLLAAGVVLVATSNRPPDDLYKDGLQREKFLPFIALLKDRLDVLELASLRDYRLDRALGMRVYLTPLGPDTAAAALDCFAKLSGGEPERAETLHILGREVHVPAAARRVARFTFEELCIRPLGAPDYLALATHYEAFVLTAVPQLSPAQRDAAKRFVTLIDALYEHKCILVCQAAAAPETLYTQGDGSFEFERTVSRLMEMQSEDYLARPHLT